MYSAMTEAERPVAGLISGIEAPRADRAAIWRKSARYRRIESSECRVRRSISVNCKPHRYSCTTWALCEIPGPMSRIWPRAGTPTPTAQQTALDLVRAGPAGEPLLPDGGQSLGAQHLLVLGGS